jgi:hypothetical protein
MKHGFSRIGRRKIQDTRFKIQDSRYKIQDTRFKIQDSRFKIQDTGYKIQDTRFKIQDIKTSPCILHLVSFLFRVNPCVSVANYLFALNLN